MTLKQKLTNKLIKKLGGFTYGELHKTYIQTQYQSFRLGYEAAVKDLKKGKKL